MNIFKLDNCPIKSAIQMCDKHVIKMIIETAQLLSTAHRILDGTEYIEKNSNGRRLKRWSHPNQILENTLYKATHINHPSAIWARQTNNNYIWLYVHFSALCDEYTHRYKKIHATQQKLLDKLEKLPDNINVGYLMPIPQAMPTKYKQSNTVEAYRSYYKGEKSNFAKWTNREIPNWW